MKNKDGDDQTKKLRAASFSAVVNVFLIILKGTVAIITGSLALFAELFNSVFDLLASALAYVGIWKAGRPADRDHHYGHEKFENLSAFAQTVLIAITSILIISEAVSRLMAPKPIEATELGLIVMVVAIGVDYYISRYLHRASRRYQSSALEADAYHFTTDLWSGGAVIVGLVFVIAGFPVFDSLAAIVVALLMLIVAYRLGRHAVDVLMDTSPRDTELAVIEQSVRSVRGVKSFHKLRARRAGSRMIIDLHIQVAPHISILQGHKIAHRVKSRLMSELPAMKEVTIHVEPHESRSLNKKRRRRT